MAKIEKHFLYPSTLFLSQTQCHITTILGSCISVCLFDPSTNIGGMNHYMLPLWNGQGLASPKYGNIAIEKLIKNMVELNCNKEHLIAKVFGGANQISNVLNIGERNGDVAKDILMKHGITIKAHSIGGQNGRKIIFDTFTGEVKMKYVSSKES